MWLWQPRLQPKYIDFLSSFWGFFLISFLIHSFIFLLIFFLQNNNISELIIIDSRTNIYKPVYYKLNFGGSGNFAANKARISSKFSRFKSKSKINSTKISNKEKSNSFLKFSKNSKKLGIAKKLKNKKLTKKQKNKKTKNNLENINPEKIPEQEIKPEITQDKIEEKLEEVKPEQEINLDNITEPNSEITINGYLMTDLELVNNIKEAVGKNWSKPRGFEDLYCEFKIFVSEDGKTVKILEQKNSKAPAFNIQSRGAILNTQFPEKCWGKELNLILR